MNRVSILNSREDRVETVNLLFHHTVAAGVYDNLKRKRQVAKASYDKHAEPLPELLTASKPSETSTNPNAPWEKGSFVAKVGPCSFLPEMGICIGGIASSSV